MAGLAAVACSDAASPDRTALRQTLVDASSVANATVTVLAGLDGLTPTAINDSDEVVGNTGASTAFFWTAAGGMHALATGGQPLTNAFAVNDYGVIAGEIGNADSVRGAVWLPDGSVRTLQSPADSIGLEPTFSCFASGINVYGVIVGGCVAMGLYDFPTIFNWHGSANDQSPNAGGVYSAVSNDGWLAGASKADNFNEPGAFIVSPAGELIRLRSYNGAISPTSSVSAIAVHGWAAGSDGNGGCQQAVAWLYAPHQSWPEFRLGTCGAATGITDDWYVVGTGADAALDATSQWAFVWSPGPGLRRLPGLGTSGEYSKAIAINARHHVLGQIVAGGVTHTVIWDVTVPSPALQP
jgi:hypothetical protein